MLCTCACRMTWQERGRLRGTCVSAFFQVLFCLYGGVTMKRQLIPCSAVLSAINTLLLSSGDVLAGHCVASTTCAPPTAFAVKTTCAPVITCTPRTTCAPSRYVTRFRACAPKTTCAPRNRACRFRARVPVTTCPPLTTCASATTCAPGVVQKSGVVQK